LVLFSFSWKQWWKINQVINGKTEENMTENDKDREEEKWKIEKT
jgi:hypothetical protein